MRRGRSGIVELVVLLALVAGCGSDVRRPASVDADVVGPRGDGGFAECASDTYVGARVPVDLLLLMDHSQSMLIGGAWEQSQSAVDRFLSLPDLEGVSLGLTLFPYVVGDEDSCRVEDYESPAVPIGPAAAVADAIRARMAATREEGSTPMGPAVVGAMRTLRAHAASSPGHVAALVLVTDGSPSTCSPDSAAGVAELVRVERDGEPSLPTYVIGFGVGPDLRQIADGGGTTLFDVAVSDVEAELYAALDAIRRVGECRYQLPPAPDGLMLDFDRVNVTVGTGADARTVPRASGAECPAVEAWRYDDPSSPAEIVLCPALCDEVRRLDAEIRLVVGCESLLI